MVCPLPIFRYKDKYGALSTFSPDRWATLDDDALIAHLDDLNDIIIAGVAAGRDTVSRIHA